MPSSSARLWVKPITPALAAAYGKNFGKLIRAWIDAIFTIEPFLAFRIPGRTNFAVCQTLFKSTFINLFHSASVIKTGSAFELTPALLTAPLTSPNFATIAL